MGEPFGVLSVHCPTCDNPVTVTVETNGDGEIYDHVQRCAGCGRPAYVVRPVSAPRPRHSLTGIKRTHPLVQLALAKAAVMLERGDMTITRIAAVVGISSDNVRRLKREMGERAGKCKCGRDQSHGGRCAWRRELENDK